MKEYPIELKLQALEISLKHADKLFPQFNAKTPSEYFSNAGRILDIATNHWDNPTADCFCAKTYQLPRNNP